jgi:hypothetical protein
MRGDLKESFASVVADSDNGKAPGADGCFSFFNRGEAFKGNG